MQTQTQIRPRLLTKEQAATYLSISKRSLERLIASKEIRPVYATGYRFKVEDLDAFVNSLEYTETKMRGQK